MKYLEKINAKIKSLDNIYSERIRKLREKNNAKYEFKLRKIESMKTRGRSVSSAEKRLQKFRNDWKNRENFHLDMKAKRVAELQEQKQSFIYRENLKKQKQQERKEHRRELQKLRRELIQREKSGWRRGNRYRQERNQLLWNLFRRPQARIGREAHNGMAIDYHIENNSGSKDVPEFLNSCRQETLRIIVPRHVPSKTQLKLELTFARRGEDGKEITQNGIISTKMILVPPGSNFESEWEYCVTDLLRKIHNFTREKSGWRIKRIIRLIIATNHYNPERGGTFIEIPKEMAAKKALINIKNEDQECFKWAITRSLFEPRTFVKNPGKVSKELREDSKKLNWENINFPSHMKDYRTFERKNSDIGLVVYTQNGKEIVPFYITKKENCKKAYIFLYKNHYLTIKNLSRLVCKNLTHHKEWVCERCARNFSKKTALQNHEAYCKNFDYVKLKFPEKDPFVKFKNYRRMQKNFLKIYADFECYQKKELVFRGEKSELISKHIPCAWGIYECREDGKNKYHEYVGENAEEKFIEKLDEIAYNFYWEFKKQKPLDISGIKDSNKCWICEKDGENLVNDHCHFTGKFRGKAHYDCNLLLRRNLDFIPVFIHNLCGYDEKLFIRKLGENTKIIARNDENFISFSNSVKVDEYYDEKEKFMEVRFLDSFKFMSGSLDNIAKILKPEDFKNTHQYFDYHEKGYFPYEYLDCMEKLEEMSLPEYIHFYSKLKGEKYQKRRIRVSAKSVEKTQV